MATIDTTTSTAALAAAPAAADTGKPKGSWFQAMATAWGETLDKQATNIEDLSARVSNGEDKPATITEMSAETMRMGFLSTASHTAISSAGEALKTMAQKS